MCKKSFWNLSNNRFHSKCWMYRLRNRSRNIQWRSIKMGNSSLAQIDYGCNCNMPGNYAHYYTSHSISNFQQILERRNERIDEDHQNTKIFCRIYFGLRIFSYVGSSFSFEELENRQWSFWAANRSLDGYIFDWIFLWHHQHRFSRLNPQPKLQAYKAMEPSWLLNFHPRFQRWWKHFNIRRWRDYIKVRNHKTYPGGLRRFKRNWKR